MGTDTPSGTPEPASVAVMRKASQTKKYADACRQVGNALNVPVADIWTAFMTAAGWVEGQPLPGSRDAPANKKLQALLSDGMYLHYIYTHVYITDHFSFLGPPTMRSCLYLLNGCFVLFFFFPVCFRPPFQPGRISSYVRRGDEGDSDPLPTPYAWECSYSFPAVAEGAEIVVVGSLSPRNRGSRFYFYTFIFYLFLFISIYLFLFRCLLFIATRKLIG